MKRHCVLIANGSFESYPDLDALSTPMGDIENLVKVLEDKRSRDTFTTTVLKDATASEIFNKLKTTFDGPAGVPDDLFIIYYSGHGLLNKNLELFLAAKDTDGDADRGNPSLRVKFADIVSLVEARNLSRVLFVLDCCHSAAAAKSFEAKGDLALELARGVKHAAADLKFNDVTVETIRRAGSYDEQHELKGDPQGNGIYLMAACSASQRALGDKKLGMGLFTKHLCDGLISEAIVPYKGKDKTIGFIPVSALFRYVSRKMEDAPQTPALYARDVTSDDLVISNIYALDRGKPGSQPSFNLWEETFLFENIAPTYILEKTESVDDRYQFIDWNATFDSVVATPLHLVRGMHVQKLLEKLDNWHQDVKLHSMKRFPPGKAPRVDIERLELRSARFGLVVFDKIASRLRDGTGRWCVTLNIAYAQRHRLFWKHLKDVMELDEMWSAYADSYDPIIGAFIANQELVKLVVDQVNGAENCLDVGAGTGNSTIRLLQMPKRTVHAIDNNSRMLRKLHKKLESYPPDFRERLQISHGDCMAVLAQVPDETYDACVMMNVLFALDRPVAYLRQIRRVLKYGGVLSFSTSRTSTDIHRLFRTIKAELMKGKDWAEKEPHFESAYQRNREMVPIIVRYSQADIEGFLERAGFEIAQEPTETYVDCVLVYKAIKRKREPYREDAHGQVPDE